MRTWKINWTTKRHLVQDLSRSAGTAAGSVRVPSSARRAHRYNGGGGVQCMLFRILLVRPRARCVLGAGSGAIRQAARDAHTTTLEEAASGA